jgi:hypothetical protein
MTTAAILDDTPSPDGVEADERIRLLETAPPHSWTPIDLTAIDASEADPPSISGLAYPGRRHVYSGEPETLKTWAVLVMALEQIRAGETVLYVDFEMGPREQVARLRDLGLTDDELTSFIYLNPSEPMTDTQVRADVDALLSERRPSLVVIDAFTGALEIHGLDPNSGVEVERFYRLVAKRLADHGAAVVLLDHLTKNKDSRGRYSIGSERKLGGADVHLGFEIVRPFGRGKNGLAKIIAHKDRPGRLARPKAAELEMVSNAETGAITWEIRPGEDSVESGAFRPTVLMQRVSEYVAEQPREDPPSRKRVEDNVKGKRAEYVRQAMDVLVSEGYLAEKSGAHGARLLTFVKRYRQEVDDDA